MPVKEFEHNGATYSVRPLTGLDKLDKDNAITTWKCGELCVALGIIETYTGTKEQLDPVPGYQFARMYTFVQWAQVTTVDKGLLKGLSLEIAIDKLATLYKEWVEMVKDADLFNKWESAYEEANLSEDNPLSESEEAIGEMMP